MPTATAYAPWIGVSRIGKLALLDFITCCIDEDYTSLVLAGQPTKDELDSAWLQLLSQYYEARGDKKQAEQMDLILKMQLIKVRAAMMHLLISSIEQVYSEVLVKRLQAYGYETVTFSRETLKEDLQGVANAELQNKLEYEALAEQLQGLIGEDKPGKKGQKGKIFYDYVRAYNKHFKTTYSVQTMSTLEYAYLCKDLDEELENLADQNDN